jgi:hypothetical protein
LKVEKKRKKKEKKLYLPAVAVTLPKPRGRVGANRRRSSRRQHVVGCAGAADNIGHNVAWATAVTGTTRGAAWLAFCGGELGCVPVGVHHVVEWRAGGQPPQPSVDGSVDRFYPEDLTVDVDRSEEPRPVYPSCRPRPLGASTNKPAAVVLGPVQLDLSDVIGVVPNHLHPEALGEGGVRVPEQQLKLLVVPASGVR